MQVPEKVRRTEKAALLSERGVTYMRFEMKFGALTARKGC